MEGQPARYWIGEINGHGSIFGGALNMAARGADNVFWTIADCANCLNCKFYLPNLPYSFCMNLFINTVNGGVEVQIVRAVEVIGDTVGAFPERPSQT